MRTSMQAMLRARGLERERGQGMVEYGLILVLVSVVAVGRLLVLGPKRAAASTSTRSGM